VAGEAVGRPDQPGRRAEIVPVSPRADRAAGQAGDPGQPGRGPACGISFARRPPPKHRHLYHGVFAPNHELGEPARHSPSGTSASGAGPPHLPLFLWERSGVRVSQLRVPGITTSHARTTCHGSRGPSSWRVGRGGVSPAVPGVWRRHPAQRRWPAGAGPLRNAGSQAGEGHDVFARVKSAPDTPRRTDRAAARLKNATAGGKARPFGNRFWGCH